MVMQQLDGRLALVADALKGMAVELGAPRAIIYIRGICPRFWLDGL
jgi:hypothetical protein